MNLRTINVAPDEGDRCNPYVEDGLDIQPFDTRSLREVISLTEADLPSGYKWFQQTIGYEGDSHIAGNAIYAEICDAGGIAREHLLHLRKQRPESCELPLEVFSSNGGIGMKFDRHGNHLVYDFMKGVDEFAYYQDYLWDLNALDTSMNGMELCRVRTFNFDEWRDFDRGLGLVRYRFTFDRGFEANPGVVIYDEVVFDGRFVSYTRVVSEQKRLDWLAADIDLLNSDGGDIKIACCASIDSSCFKDRSMLGASLRIHAKFGKAQNVIYGDTHKVLYNLHLLTDLLKRVEKVDFNL